MSETKSDTKECPFCSEQIKATAKKCRYCGEWLDTAAPPATSPAFAPVVGVVGFAPPAVALVNGLEAGQVFDLLTRLVDRNLVVYEEDENGQGRYRLLETVRQYTRERLMESGQGEALRDRHREHFLAYAEAAASEIHGPQQVRSLDLLEAEHENLRAALEWCTATNEQAGLLRLAAALAAFWELRAHLTEGRERLHAVLERTADLPPSRERVHALFYAALMASFQGDRAVLHPLTEEALAVARSLDDPESLALALSGMGSLARTDGDITAARGYLEEALAAVRRHAGSSWTTGWLLQSLAEVARRQGDLDTTRQRYEESIAAKRAQGAPLSLAVTLMVFGQFLEGRGETGVARCHYEESLLLSQQAKSEMGIANNSLLLAGIAWRERDFAAFRDLTLCGLAVHRALRTRPFVAYGLNSLATLALIEGRHERAARLYGADEALRASISDPPPPPSGPGDPADHARRVADLRAALGEESFAAAWAAGRVMSWEAATQFALRDPEP